MNRYFSLTNNIFKVKDNLHNEIANNEWQILFLTSFDSVEGFLGVHFNHIEKNRFHFAYVLAFFP